MKLLLILLLACVLSLGVACSSEPPEDIDATVQALVVTTVAQIATPTPYPTLTPYPTPTPYPGKMITARTILGSDDCLKISQDNEFCIEVLASDVENEYLEKIHDSLGWASSIFTVSKADLTTELGIHDYLGIALWNGEISNLDVLAGDICRSHLDFGDARAEDCKDLTKKMLQSRSGRTGASASGANISHSSGFIILASYPSWATYATDDIASQRRDFRKVLSHEYFHSYQAAHRLRVPQADRGALWLNEGSAEYAANIVAAKAGWVDWEHALRWSMDAIQWARKEAPGLSISMNETKAQQAEIGLKFRHVLTYEMGFWASAFASHLGGGNAILIDYWDDYEELGWRDSFKSNVGHSVEEFYVLFEEFLSDHDNDQNFDWLSQFPVPNLP